MAFPTTNAVTELPAINQILASCGQAPVTTLDSTNPDVAIAYDTLLEVSREVQTEGWSFNKENHYPFEPNNDNEIVIPSNVLQIDLTNNGTNGSKDSIIRNGKLYDKQNHKDNDWTETVECDVIWFFDWVDLPGPIKDYITARAATVTSSRIVGDQNQYAMLQQKEAYMRAMALEYECNQGDYSYFGKPDNSEPYVSYEPYKALMR
jgi:hypothetical protein